MAEATVSFSLDIYIFGLVEFMFPACLLSHFDTFSNHRRSSHITPGLLDHLSLNLTWFGVPSPKDPPSLLLIGSQVMHLLSGALPGGGGGRGPLGVPPQVELSSGTRPLVHYVICDLTNNQSRVVSPARWNR